MHFCLTWTAWAKSSQVYSCASPGTHGKIVRQRVLAILHESNPYNFANILCLNFCIILYPYNVMQSVSPWQAGPAVPALTAVDSRVKPVRMIRMSVTSSVCFNHKKLQIPYHTDLWRKQLEIIFISGTPTGSPSTWKSATPKRNLHYPHSSAFKSSHEQTSKSCYTVVFETPI